MCSNILKNIIWYWWTFRTFWASEVTLSEFIFDNMKTQAVIRVQYMFFYTTGQQLITSWQLWSSDLHNFITYLSEIFSWWDLTCVQFFMVTFLQRFNNKKNSVQII